MKPFANGCRCKGGAVVAWLVASALLFSPGAFSASAEAKMAEMARIWALVPVSAVTVTAVSDGNWSDPSTWSPARAPVSGDRIHIPENRSVVVDSVISAQYRSIRLEGELSFATDTATQLVVDTLVGSGESTLTIGTVSSPVQASAVARFVVNDYNNEGINQTDATASDYDPATIGQGIITMGRFETHGAVKTPGGSLATEPSAGDTEITLGFDPDGWTVGDSIVIAGTTRDALGDEKRTIAAINGRVITLNAALGKNHHTVMHSHADLELQVHVINLSRNVIIESAAEDRAPTTVDYTYTQSTLDSQYTIDLFHGRGHVMIMHSNDSAVRYTRFFAMGRTNKHGAIDDPVFDADGNLAHAGKNSRARYPLHFHRAGISGAPAIVEGSSAEDTPGWCFVNHSSRVNMINNVAYDCDGAAFVTEAGDELGSMISNIAIRNTADEGKNRTDLRFQARKDINDFGFGGHGYWLQGINVDVQDNIASGAGREAYAVYPLLFDDAEDIRFPLDELPLTHRSSFSQAPSPAQVPTHTFANNTAYGSNIGLMVGEHRPDVPSSLNGFTGWMLQMGVSFNYSDSIDFNNIKLIGNLDTPEGLGAYAHHGTSHVTFDKPHVEGFALGLQVPRAGNQAVDIKDYKYSSIKEAYLNNVLNIHMLQTRNHDFLQVDIEKPEFGTLTTSALAHGLTALAAIDQTDDLDIDASNVRSNGFAELTSLISDGEIDQQLNYFFHFTQQGGTQVDFRHQRDALLPKIVRLTQADGKQYRLYFKDQQQESFVPYPSSKYVSGRDYDPDNPTDPDAPGGNNRNANLPVAFIDATNRTIADLYQSDAANPYWKDFAQAKDRLDTAFDVDASSEYPGFALVPNGKLLPTNYQTDPRFQELAQSLNVVAMRVDDIAGFTDYQPAEAQAGIAIKLDFEDPSNRLGYNGNLKAVPLPPASPVPAVAATQQNGSNLWLDGIFDAYELQAPFALTQNSFTWSANLRPVSLQKGVIFEHADQWSGYQVSLKDGRVQLKLKAAGQQLVLLSSTGLTAGNWAEVTFSVNQGLGQAMLYVNGVREAVASVLPFQTAGDNTLLLGASSGSHFTAAGRYRGFIDDIRLEQRTFSDATITDLVAQRKQAVTEQSAMDSDGDGIADTLDATPLDASSGSDADSDGLADTIDPDVGNAYHDADNDGVPDAFDQFASDSGAWSDIDFDGLPDNTDDDTDGDGVVNTLDQFPYDGLETLDSDNDGVGDNRDQFPNDPAESLDSDNDGVGNNSDALPYLSAESEDSDGDGYGDVIDGWPNDPEWAVANNLLANGQFDVDTVGWQLAQNNGQASRDEVIAYNSAASVKVVGESGSGYVHWESNTISLPAGADTMRVSGYVKTTLSSGSQIRAIISYNDAGSVKKSYRNINIPDGTADWVLYDEQFSLPANAFAVVLRLRTTGTNGSTAWFDNVALNATAATDTDQDGIADRVDADDDNDGFLDGEDPAPLLASVVPVVDNDHDGIADATDNCPLLANANQIDTDHDNIGNVCDVDDDADRVLDWKDAFALDHSESVDTDNDGIGNEADPDDDNDTLPDAFEIANGLDSLNASDALLDLDGDGVSNLDEYHANTPIDKDTVAPVLAAPPTVQVDSTGPLTPVDLGVAQASDVLDGALTATPSNAGPFPAGRHIINWQVSDAAGNTATAEQVVEVTPQVSISGMLNVVPGQTLELILELNGPAVAYPVQIPYTVAADFGADVGSVGAGGVTGVASIDAGTQVSVSIDTQVLALTRSASQILATAGTPSNAINGSKNSHTVILNWDSVAMVTGLSISQAGMPVARISATAGMVTVQPNYSQAIDHARYSFDWSQSDPRLNLSNDMTAAVLTFDPASVEAGLYRFQITVAPLDSATFESSASATVEVVSGNTQTTDEQQQTDSESEDNQVEDNGVEDSDAEDSGVEDNGIEDNEAEDNEAEDNDVDSGQNNVDPLLDTDGDRVPDVEDITDQLHHLQSGIDDAILQTQSGLRLVLGNIAYAAENPHSMVSLENIKNHGSADLQFTELATDSEYSYVAGIFDFEIHDMQVGASAPVVIPLLAAVPANAVYRKYTPEFGWRDFITDANNRIFSAPGEPGVCPAPGDSDYVPGLSAGHHCVQLDIQDGGPNDADGVANGLVRDPGGVAVQELDAPTVSAAEHSSMDNRVFDVAGEHVVLGFTLSSSNTDAALEGLTLATDGELDLPRAVSQIKLYFDRNENGIAEAVELLAAAQVVPTGTDVSFVLDQPLALPVGDAAMLVTYTFRGTAQ